jgi:galactofuranosylgalactofuranosylrhamnosyl-N-acetylglucosaminyl-diphospho-decaprenol beta-1,5/1,6-galactofuranosyltransferase
VTGDATALRVLQRVIFPVEDLDIVPLYVETNPERGAGELASELAMEAQTGRKAKAVSVPVPSAAVGEAQHSIRFGTDVPADLIEDAGLRRSAVITRGRRVSFGTYFNAFPASYWRRWTTVTSVTLRIRLAGESTIILYQSTAKGFSHPVETITVESDQPTTVQRTLPLAPFIDGGWYWFDIVAGPQGTTLIEADWLGMAEDAKPGRVSLGITTFNQPDFMLETLRTLGDASEIHDVIDRIYVIDQGSDKVVDRPAYTESTKKLGDRVEVIEQGNLGGSGGFARAMDETVRAGRAAYVLLMDDDVKLEPEGILRAATFADMARRPTIVGGHMFSLYDRSLLHAYAESIESWTWWWGPAPNTTPRHDFGRRNLRNTPWLHRRADGDYNGTWMCLIPTSVITEIGLIPPMFIKWDDAEYGVRARDHGIPTVSLPGVGCWQVPWDDKDDARDWQAYYHLRNRLVSALLHSPHKAGGGLINESRERQLQALLGMYYSTAALQQLAVEDVLRGPEHMHRDLPTKIGQLRELRARYQDARYQADLESFPPPRRKAPDSLKANTTPTNKINLLTTAARGTLRQFRAPRPGAAQRPQMALPYQDASWWVLAKLDSALVSSAENTNATWLIRDRGQFRALGWRSLVLHRRLARRWSRLAAEYRAAAADFNSPERWRETFAASVAERADRQSAERQPAVRQFPENQ